MIYTEEVLERARQAVKIGQAILDGKEIEFSSTNGFFWQQAKTPTLDFSSNDYRVKPEPAYEPFDFSDAEFLIGKVVKEKEYSNVAIISKVNRQGVEVFIHTSFGVLFDKFVFLDGTPCGKLKQ